MNFSTIYLKFKRWASYNPPGALTSEGWESFEYEFSINAPIRYWFDNNFKKMVIYPIKWKYNDISDWIRYRTYNKYHIVLTGLPPGYSEVDNTMLHVNFNLLKDFVEIDKASRVYCESDTHKTWFEKHMPLYRLVFPFRRADLGLKHLEWEMSLDDPNLPAFEQSPQQAKFAREIYALYNWWTITRPLRVEVDLMFPDNVKKLVGTAYRATPEYKKYRAAVEKSIKQEERWHKEDDKMLQRLVKIRRGLWV